MIIRCSWHNGIIGEKEPLEDKRITDGICETCAEKLLAELALAVSPRAYYGAGEPEPDTVAGPAEVVK